jgi:hypothetical protein
MRQVQMEQAAAEVDMKSPLKAMGARLAASGAPLPLRASPGAGAGARAGADAAPLSTTTRQGRSEPTHREVHGPVQLQERVVWANGVLASWATVATANTLSKFATSTATSGMHEPTAATVSPAMQQSLPHVDSRAQLPVRRKLLLQQMDRLLPPILSGLGVAKAAARTAVGRLVDTFDLHMHHVSFKPAELVLLLVVLLAAIAPNLPELATGFAKPHAVHGTALKWWIVRLQLTEEQFETLIDVLHGPYAKLRAGREA